MDIHLIIPSIQRAYDDLCEDPRFIDKIGDINLVAQGSQVLIEKEQAAVRMLELLNAANNPIDSQIMGVKGRAYLLGEVARMHNIDPEKVLAGMLNIGSQPQQPAGAGPQGSPAKEEATLNAAGQPVGQQNKQMPARGGHPEAAPAGQGG
jgi:hypothetical protein